MARRIKPNLEFYIQRHSEGVLLSGPSHSSCLPLSGTEPPPPICSSSTSGPQVLPHTPVFKPFCVCDILSSAWHPHHGPGTTCSELFAPAAAGSISALAITCKCLTLGLAHCMSSFQLDVFILTICFCLKKFF